MTEPAPLLALHDVAYVLPFGRRLFANVDFAARPGRAYAVVGPSGVGKSTLLAVLSGLLAPSAGTCVTRPHRQFAWVFQTLNSLSARSLLANALLYAALDGDRLDDARERAALYLESVGLDSRIDRRSRTLSGGELQRASVARALVSRRPVILADEPTSQLDPENASRVMTLLGDAGADGRSVVVVTHDVGALPGSFEIVRLEPNGLKPVRHAAPGGGRA